MRLTRQKAPVQEKRVKSYFSGMMYVCIGITYEDRYTNGSC